MYESDLLFFSSSASFQGYLHPYGSTENDRKRCSSYSRPIGGAWHSQKWRRRDGACAKSLHAENKQAVEEETEHKKKTKMASARKPESFVWTNNEVKLLLWLTLNYKASKLQERGFRGRRPEVEGWGDGVIVSESIHTRTQGFWIFPPWDPFSKKCVFRRCVYRIRGVVYLADGHFDM